MKIIKILFFAVAMSDQTDAKSTNKVRDPRTKLDRFELKCPSSPVK